MVVVGGGVGELVNDGAHKAHPTRVVLRCQ